MQGTHFIVQQQPPRCLTTDPRPRNFLPLGISFRPERYIIYHGEWAIVSSWTISLQRSKRLALGVTRQPIAFADFDLRQSNHSPRMSREENHASCKFVLAASNLLPACSDKNIEYAMCCRTLCFPGSLHQTYQASRLYGNHNVRPCDSMGYPSSSPCQSF